MTRRWHHRHSFAPFWIFTVPCISLVINSGPWRLVSSMLFLLKNTLCLFVNWLISVKLKNINMVYVMKNVFASAHQSCSWKSTFPHTSLTFTLLKCVIKWLQPIASGCWVWVSGKCFAVNFSAQEKNHAEVML